MSHIPIGTSIRIRGYAPRYNGLLGHIVDRDGEYYYVTVVAQDHHEEDEYEVVLECYQSEFEVVV